MLTCDEATRGRVEAGGTLDVSRCRCVGGWHATFDRRNFGVIPYGVASLDPTFIANAKKNAGFIYVTDDSMPNPWDSVPAYFGDLVAQLAI